MSQLPSYLELYAVADDETRPNFEAACWESEAVQQRRFAVLVDLYGLEGKQVLDAGCGRGDLAAFLRQERIRVRRYVGLDALASVIEHARRRALPRCEFERVDLVVEPSFTRWSPDVILFSGTLNTLGLEQARAVLDAAWSATRDALLFNFLPDTAGPGATTQHAPIRRHPTHELLAWAFSKTSQVAFRQDYFDHGHDATIRLLKE